MTKIELILGQVAVEKESAIGAMYGIMSLKDVLYTGTMTFGPNFNPRPENVMATTTTYRRHCNKRTCKHTKTLLIKSGNNIPYTHLLIFHKIWRLLLI